MFCKKKHISAHFKKWQLPQLLKPATSAMLAVAGYIFSAERIDARLNPMVPVGKRCGANWAIFLRA
jgi:hypothetical protein